MRIRNPQLWSLRRSLTLQAAAQSSRESRAARSTSGESSISWESKRSADGLQRTQATMSRSSAEISSTNSVTFCRGSSTNVPPPSAPHIMHAYALLLRASRRASFGMPVGARDTSPIFTRRISAAVNRASSRRVWMTKPLLRRSRTRRSICVTPGNAARSSSLVKTPPSPTDAFSHSAASVRELTGLPRFECDEESV